MKDLSPEEKKTFGSEVNQLKAMASEKIEQKIEELKKKEVEREIASMRPFDITAPSNIVKGSYNNIQSHLCKDSARLFLSQWALLLRIIPKL